MATPWGAIAGGIAGGLFGAISSYNQTKKKATAYKQAADIMKNAAQEYSGANATHQETQAGLQNAIGSGNLSAAGVAQNVAPTGTQFSQLANAANTIQSDQSMANGYNAGQSQKATELGGKLSQADAQAKNLLQAANVDYDVSAAQTQGLLNGLGTVANTVKNIKSDENCKEALPEASVEDALRQIASIVYKYKPETGEDQDIHVGITAQSMEGTAFDDVVSEGADGFKQLDKQKLLESVMAGIASLQKEIDAIGKEGKTNKSNIGMLSDERCKMAENTIESNPIQAAASLPQGSPIQKEAVQAAEGGKGAEVNNEVIDEAVSKYSAPWNGWTDEETYNMQDELMEPDGIFKDEHHKTWTDYMKEEYPDVEAWQKLHPNIATSFDRPYGYEYSRDKDGAEEDRNKYSKYVDDSLRSFWESFRRRKAFEKRTQEETAAMNEGLSEDDPDYFTSDERCKQAETAIEANPVEAAASLPQGSPIQKEAVQAAEGGKGAEVNNEVIDAYTKELQNVYGDRFAAYKQNDYMKQMPQDATLDNLAETDWFKNARSQVGPEYFSGDFLYGRQPGFDIDEEWIKANDPNAYKTYGFNDNEGIDDYDKWGDYRNDHINSDARDFADFMDKHPELNYSDVMSAYGDRYKKATGKDFPMEEFRGYSDKRSEELNIKKFDKELYNTAKEALGENDHFSDKDWDNIKDDIISYIEQTGKIPGFNPYDAGSNDRIAEELWYKICEEYGDPGEWYIGKKIKEAADKREAELKDVDMSRFTSDEKKKETPFGFGRA